MDELIAEDAFVDNCRTVIERLEGRTDFKFTEAEARKVMKSKGMTYRKVVHIPIGANSNRNLILRQRWVMAALDRDHKQRVYLNINETWLGMSDFRRRKWQAYGTTNSVAAFSMAPRVTMTVGADSLGNVYFSLSQSNSNQATFGLFMRQLVLKLDKERPNWRRNTLVTLDGARYHRTQAILDLFASLDIPVAMLGPYR